MQKLSILIYHRVLEAPDPLQPGIVDRVIFERQMWGVSRFFRVLPLLEAVNRLRDGTLPRRAVSVSFDDGYRDNVDIALPILRRLGVHATFFIATGFLNGTCMWNDRVIEAVRRLNGVGLDLREFTGKRFELPAELHARSSVLQAILRAIKYLPFAQREAGVSLIEGQAASRATGLMMREADVRALTQAGMGLGAHTVNHPILSQLSVAEARSEIVESRKTLESITGRGVRLFAYPNGKPGLDYVEDHVAIVRELGFDAAVSTKWGSASIASDRYQLPRFTPWDRSLPRYLVRLSLMRLRPPPISTLRAAFDTTDRNEHA
ncbi:polysaccharide deacetylase family protein [Nitrococcus mobilis]|uniref:Polysaccharide deacetylase n=1 Tax=Nitrococcus mobilis Nb-231 TaxID=314278 RepID=A4BSJ3_9GAMM|nr:polysaccharide deacetylase family protein [Nitrococcus mobilis]EAR21263.1 Polysaccharide deacetylase [Nitrococcus mobilis Nb-231]